jgi:hypothetical protein
MIQNLNTNDGDDKLFVVNFALKHVKRALILYKRQERKCLHKIVSLYGNVIVWHHEYTNCKSINNIIRL